MRVAAVLLILVVTFSLMTETEAGWLRRTWRKVRRWVKEHVRVQVGIERRYRSTDKLSAAAATEEDGGGGGKPSLMGCSLAEILHEYGCDVDNINQKVTAETEDAIFERSDTNQDQTLDDKEKKTFELMFLAEILEACLEQKVASTDNDVM